MSLNLQAMTLEQQSFFFYFTSTFSCCFPLCRWLWCHIYLMSPLNPTGATLLHNCHLCPHRKLPWMTSAISWPLSPLFSSPSRPLLCLAICHICLLSFVLLEYFPTDRNPEEFLLHFKHISERSGQLLRYVNEWVEERELLWCFYSESHQRFAHISLLVCSHGLTPTFFIPVQYAEVGEPPH